MPTDLSAIHPRFALKFVNDIRMVHTNGKMLIASNSAMVGVMNHHAIARSDIPATGVVACERADARGIAVTSSVVVGWFTVVVPLASAWSLINGGSRASCR